MKEELIKKLKAEMEKFKEKIRESGVDYAIDRAYEITVKEELKCHIRRYTVSSVHRNLRM